MLITFTSDTLGFHISVTLENILLNMINAIFQEF